MPRNGPSEGALETPPSRLLLPLRYGFRAFFPLAAIAGAALVPVWLAALAGAIPLPPGGMTWHAHEMVHGFAMAVLAGFFLTAVPRWTNTEPVRGAALAALVGLWLAGRAVAWAPGVPLRGVVVAALPLAVAAVTGVPILRSRSRRNYAFPVLLLALAAAAFTGQTWPQHAPAAARGGVYAVVAILVVFGGRITPLFTENALKLPVRARGRIDDLAIGSALAALCLRMVPAPPAVVAGAAAVAGLLNLWRMRGWHARAALRQPLLWVLHAGYLWIGVGLLLEAGAAVGRVPSPLALHVLTVGAVGTYTLGMTARVALGHTGRSLVAPRPIAAAFVLAQLAVWIRVAAPLAAPAHTPWALWASGLIWSLCWVIYLAVYVPILTAPRPDGAPG